MLATFAQLERGAVSPSAEPAQVPPPHEAALPAALPAAALLPLASVASVASVAADGSAAEAADEGPPSRCPSCAVCEYECYLSAVECALPDGRRCYLCPSHSVESAHVASRLDAEHKTLVVFRSTRWLRGLLSAVSASADAASGWIERARAALSPADGGRRCTVGEAQAIVDAGVALRMDDEHMLALARVRRTPFERCAVRARAHAPRACPMEASSAWAARALGVCCGCSQGAPAMCACAFSRAPMTRVRCPA
jgi:hypothetical protein